MRLFAFVCALALLGIGAASYYGWEERGWSGPVLTSAVPAFAGAAMLLGLVVSLLFRKTGMQLAFLAALIGGGLAVGRLLPAYLKVELDTGDSFTRLLIGMAVVCVVYVVVAAGRFVFRARPARRRKGTEDDGGVGEPASSEAQSPESSSRIDLPVSNVDAMGSRP